MRCVIYHHVLNTVLILHLCESFLPYVFFFFAATNFTEKEPLTLATELGIMGLNRLPQASLKRMCGKEDFGSVLMDFGEVFWMYLSAFTCYKFPCNKLGHLYLGCGLATVGICCLEISLLTYVCLCSSCNCCKILQLEM